MEIKNINCCYQNSKWENTPDLHVIPEVNLFEMRKNVNCKREPTHQCGVCHINSYA